MTAIIKNENATKQRNNNLLGKPQKKGLLGGGRRQRN